MLTAALASLMMLTTGQDIMSVQDPSVPQPPAVDLEDIVVEGRPLEDLTQTFVREVAAPARNRGMARWRDGLCVGVANLQPDMAQYITDRVSTVARDVGLRPGEPGCEPHVLIVATIDASTFTRQFVEARPRLFRVGGSGMDRGAGAFKAFIENDQPVRWWNVSVPVNDETGLIAVRLPGEEAPRNGVQPSRITTQIVDDTKRSFIIVDVDKTKDVSLEQLADYIAFVALAQVDPEADTSGYATILNVFDDPAQTRTLTNWDRAYLQGLYDTIRRRKNFGAQRTEVVDSIVRVHQQLTTETDAATND
ncbi:hypothetical protein [Brevundimonas variabilis]|uniref:Uncharacterized protein n=1 Tax=Brevundimonas variabilis TaxID=74312 RepID=A0A7W9CI62_9CAUL|nr:hypothetical protein [Brevundimonas variabilis]MBB5745833.1 hypothetical protein [Brevundimonas variabilis]